MAITLSLEKYNIDGALDATRPASNANALISIDGAAPLATLGTWNNTQGGGFVEYTLHASEEAAMTDRALLILPEVADTWRVSWARHRLSESGDAAAFLAALYAREHRAGRTFLGFLRRLDAFVVNAASGMGGTNGRFAKPGGDPSETGDCEFYGTLSVDNTERGEANVAGSEET